ncbi:monocarboxylate transporter 11-like [Patiria miniata]|uniref:Major facilitator superfamily (MFS) profile domain-containing protein n=1 Tax=Patiria miniata TaxID=46514 RepID=A0A914BI55_PATMI|nr:monocarboxylate transporter 11-like [Patiria miniata]
MGCLSAQVRSGWCAVLSLHMTWLVWTGLIKGLGVMLPVLQEEFQSSTWLVGWTIAIINGISDFVGPFAGPLEMKFGPRMVIMMSGVLIGGSLVVASLATSVIQFAVSLTLLSGCGISFANILTRAMVGRYFTTHYTAANGIGHAGHSVALIVFAPLTQLLLDTYGWRGAMLLLGGICMHLVPCGTLFTDRPTARRHGGASGDEYEPLPGDSESPPHSSKCCCCCLELQFSGARCAQNFGLEVFEKASFYLTAVLFICNRLVNDLWVIYFVDHVYAKGLSGQDAVTFTAAAGVANLVAKVAHGPVVDRGWMGLRTMMVVTITVAAACLFTDPWMNTYWWLMVNAVVFMGAAGVIGALLDVYTKDLLGADYLVSAFSWMGVLSGFATTSLGFLPGWMYDVSGSYDGAFILMGGIWSVSLVVMVMEGVMYKLGWITRDSDKK